MQEKIDKFSFTNNNENLNNLSKTFDEEDAIGNTNIFEDTISAIVNLGYSKSDVYLVVNSIYNENSENEKLSIEKIIPLALKKLSK